MRPLFPSPSLNPTRTEVQPGLWVDSGLAGSRPLILPAFSPWSAGTPWNDRRAAGESLWGIAPNRIFALPRTPALPVVTAV